MHSATQAIVAAAAAMTILVFGSGCAGPAPTSAQDGSDLSDVDRYRARVEASARRQGIKVLWANPPRARSTRSETATGDDASEVIRLRRERSGDDEDDDGR